jgi:hypothetical protein
LASLNYFKQSNLNQTSNYEAENYWTYFIR